MQYVCDAPNKKTWFRIETEGEAMMEAEAMHHSLDYRFRHAREAAIGSYMPPAQLRPFERNIGLGAHIARTMPLFLTLRDNEGTPLATAMLPQSACGDYPPSVVGPDYADAYRSEDGAIAALEKHLGRTLRRESYNPFETCIP